VKGFLAKLKGVVAGKLLGEGLGKTREKFAQGIRRVLAGRAGLDPGSREELEEVLLGADVGVAATTRLLDRLDERIEKGGLEEGESLEDIFAEEMVAILRVAEKTPPTEEPVTKPRVILLVGVNGTGKTTTLGKLAHHYGRMNRRVLVAAADTFRAAASDQLRIWTDRAGADLIAGQPGGDPAAVAFDAVARAQARGYDIVLVDTAGRLQTKANLMEELAKVRRVIGKRMPGAPHEVLLVLDATTGQNALQQAREFGKLVEVTGIVLTKVDGTAKGGIVIAIALELGIPVQYLGLGEGLQDLAPFAAEPFVAALLGTT
jgi:fused signal recognition particle receptor